MTFTHAEELMALLREQNLFMNRITIALEALVEAKKSENFHRMYSKISNEDLAAR